MTDPKLLLTALFITGCEPSASEPAEKNWDQDFCCFGDYENFFCLVTPEEECEKWISTGRTGRWAPRSE